MTKLKKASARVLTLLLTLMILAASLPTVTVRAAGLQAFDYLEWNTYEYGRIFASVANVSPTDDRYSIRYDYEFYKDGTMVDELSSEDCSIYVLDIMQEYGFGKYTYKVRAVEMDPMTEEPTGMENDWQESEEFDYKAFEGAKTGEVNLSLSRNHPAFGGNGLDATGDVTILDKDAKYNAFFSSDGGMVSTNGTFYQGHPYTVSIFLDFQYGTGEFEDADRLRVTVNGEPAIVDVSGGLSATVHYTFPHEKSAARVSVGGKELLSEENFGKEIFFESGGSAKLTAGETDDSYMLTLDGTCLEGTKKEFLTEFPITDETYETVSHSYGIMTNRDLTVELKGSNVIGSEETGVFYGIIAEEDAGLTFEGDGILDIYTTKEEGLYGMADRGIGISTSDRYCGLYINSGNIHIHAAENACGMVSGKIIQRAGTLEITAQKERALKIARGGEYDMYGGEATFSSYQEDDSCGAVDISLASFTLRGGTMTAQSPVAGYGIYGDEEAEAMFYYEGGTAQFVGGTAAASCGYDLWETPQIYTSSSINLTFVEPTEDAESVFSGEMVRAAVLKQPQRVTTIDIGGIWTDLQVGQPVQFTAALNPNVESSDQVEIENEGWIDADTLEPLAAILGEYSGTPKYGRTYTHFMNIRVKDGFEFSRNLKVLYNSEEVSVGINFPNNRTAHITYTVPSVTMPIEEGKAIKEVAVENATISYKDGDSPKFTAAVPEKYKEMYMIERETITDAKGDGVSSDNIPVTDAGGATMKLKAGKEYYYAVELSILDDAYEAGYRFDEKNLSFLLNGEKAEMGRCIAEGNYIYLQLKAPIDVQCAHKNTAITGKKTATCKAAGYTGDTVCNDCKEIVKKGTAKAKDPKNHTGKTAVINKKTATCKAAGYTGDTVCNDCKAVLKKGKSIAKKAHTLKTTVKKATTSKDGKITKTCTACKSTVSSTTVYKASKLSLSTTKFTYNGKEQKPTVKVKTSKGQTLKNGTDYTVTYTGNRKNVGRYAIKVTLKGNYSGSKTLYYTIVPQKVKITSAKSASKKIAVSWTTLRKECSGYEIQYSLKSDFKKSWSVTVSNRSKMKWIRSLKAKTIYHVRIRSFKKVSNKKYYSDWSNVKSAKTK